MAQHQNFSSFATNEECAMQPTQGKDQQFNGKTLTPDFNVPATVPFDPGNTDQYASHQSSELYHLPESLQNEETAAIDSNISIEPETLKPLFDLENPPAHVPANIIQLSDNQQVTETEPELESTEISTKLEATKSQTVSEAHSDSDMESQTPARNIEETIQEPDIETKAKKTERMSRKRRRRIVQLNDDSDEEDELRKELEQQISPDKEKKDAKESGADNSCPNSDSDEDITDIGVIKVRSLLKSAVIIHVPSSKRKKQRVLDSDEEDDPQTSVDVDDIGLVDSNENDNEIDDDSYVTDIIVSEPVFELGECVPIENPIIEEVDFLAPHSPPPKHDQETAEETSGNVEKFLVTEKRKNDDGGDSAEIDAEEVDVAAERKVGTDITPEKALVKTKPLDDNDEFFTFDRKVEESDDQLVSNEDYFGTPDMSKPRSRNRSSKSNSKRKPEQKSSSSTGRRKRSNKYLKDTFIDDTDSDSDTSFSLSSESSPEESRPPPRPVITLKPPVFTHEKKFIVKRVPIKKKPAKSDRFYDKSRDIPNDVYFGDVKVPLHILHSRWDARTDSDTSEPEIIVPRSLQLHVSSVPIPKKPNFQPRLRPTPTEDLEDDPKLSTMKEFARVSGIKINFIKLFNGVRSTDDKCMMIRRILAQKGLKGEATLAKCKQLKLDLQAKRESAELDKSVIITSEGRRTRRSARTEAGSSAVVQPETLQTLSKIRRVVDSDSE